MAERAERERQIRSAENLRWAQERAAARAEAEQAERNKPKQQDTPKMTTSNGQWEAWVNSRIKSSRDASEKSMSGALADLLIKERSARAKVESDIATLCQELAALKYEVAELKGELKTKSALEAMAERLDKIEQQRTPLRAIGKALTA